MPITCIIPAYNEAPRITQTLNLITQIPAITEVVVVNDGSTDNTTAVIQQHPEIILINHAHNLGKSAAVKTGLAYSHNQNLLLYDADASVNLAYLNKLSVVFEQQSVIDCLILQHDDDLLISWLFNAHILLSGLRFIRKPLLHNILSLPINRYQLEVAMNDYFITRQSRVVYALYPQTKPLRKINKTKFYPALIAEARCWYDILSYNSNHSWLYQRFFYHPPPLKYG